MRVLLLVLILLFGCIQNVEKIPLNKTEDNNSNIINNKSIEINNSTSSNATFDQNVSQNEIPPLLTTQTEFPSLPNYSFVNKTSIDGKLIVSFFYLPGCSACKEVRPDIENFKKVYKNIQWDEYDLTTQNGTMAYLEFAQEYNLSMNERLVPQVLVNGTIITDQFNIRKKLGGILGNYSMG